MDPLPTASTPPFSSAQPTKEERTWAMIIHLSALAGFIPLAHLIVPLVLWMTQRDTSAFVDDQGKEAVNAQISVTIYGLVAGALCIVLIGFALLPVLVVANIVLVIVAAMAAFEGRPYRYPFILRLVK